MILYNFLPAEEFQQAKLILYTKQEIEVSNLTQVEFEFMGELLKGQTVLIEAMLKAGFKFQEQTSSVTITTVKPFDRNTLPEKIFEKEYNSFFPYKMQWGGAGPY